MVHSLGFPPTGHPDDPQEPDISKCAEPTSLVPMKVLFFFGGEGRGRVKDSYDRIGIFQNNPKEGRGL